ncbi:WecB/TagA/CpsF family glycosyltransferase [bacterium]|jgi:N-acetylglucosaminyldiphosphoundecaprenol N-acetyl-beta-D-mannosaminyltransferase|nr:WecB/TagA/CpsF family glycosyltransferase [bacterium]
MAINFLGMRLEEWTVEELHNRISEAVKHQHSIEILNLNAHGVNLCFDDPEFFEILKTTQHIFCDGEGVRFAVNQRGGEIPYRITYADWMPQFLSWAQEEGLRVFFYGARQAVLQKAVERVHQTFPRLNLCGSVHGYVSEELAVAEIIRAAPHVVFVGLGMPLQEKWIRRNKDRISVNCCLSAGAAFDYLAGTVPRAPGFFRKFGMEWFFRYLIEPRRMFKRYILGNPKFLYRVFRNRPPE